MPQLRIEQEDIELVELPMDDLKSAVAYVNDLDEIPPTTKYIYATMDLIQSQINQSEARIRQFEESELFTTEEKTRLIAKETEILEMLQLKKADKIIVTNPENVE
jgi:hypothetical protein